jgi:hypothetical protein
LIKYLGENKISKRPSYISADFFSKAVLKILFDKGKLEGDTACIEGLASDEKFIYIKRGASTLHEISETKTLLLTMLDNSNNDLELFKEKLENWFDETMHRASGWYKKQSQLITLLIGFAIAVAFNVDTIKLVQILATDKNAAQKMTALSVQYIETHKDSTGHLSEYHDSVANIYFKKTNSIIQTDVKNANQIIGIGWDYSDSLKKYCNNKVKNHEKCVKPCFLKKIPIKTNYQKVEFIFSNFNFRTILGYIITAIAISFGAPFWFDLLSKVVSIRGAGKKPVSKKVEKE